MLANASALIDLVIDRTYDRKICGNLYILQDEKWRKLYAVLKANLLFMFESENSVGKKAPLLLIMVEDCLIELSDDNKTGKAFSFSIKFKTTGRIFELAALDFESLGNWISFLTITSVDYMLATRHSLQQHLQSNSNCEDCPRKNEADKEETKFLFGETS